jgi:hypothetical protein
MATPPTLGSTAASTSAARATSWSTTRDIGNAGRANGSSAAEEEEEEEEEEEDGGDDDDARDGVASGRRARRERGASARGDGASMMCARRATRAVAPLVVFSHETRFRSFPERKHFFF